MRNRRQHVLRIITAPAIVLTLATVAEAGPPLICHPFDPGTASVLPWAKGQGWNTPDRSYDVRRLTADMLRLLEADAPVLARMENMRRATIYASQNPHVAAELLTAVLGRALSAAAHGSRDPLAWFDAGYLIESYRQASFIYRWDMLSNTERSSWTLRSEPRGLDGYILVLKAIELSGTSRDMELAASLMKEGALPSDHAGISTRQTPRLRNSTAIARPAQRTR
jgi:hypothetical protein